MKTKSPWVTFVVLLSGIFVTLEASSFLSPALPYITQTFSLPTQFAGFVTVFYYITAIALSPLFGRLGDQIGRKKIVLAGLLIFSLSEFLGAVSPTLPVFLFARFLQGIGYACIFPNVFAYITDLFTEEKRGRAIGIFMLFTYIATGTGGIISGALIGTFGWRSIFLTSGILAFIGFILVWKIVPKNALQETRTKINYVGASIFMLVIASVVTIPITIGNFGLVSIYTLLQIVVIVLILSGLLLYEKRVESPLIDLSVLKIKGIAVSGALITIQNLIMLSIINSLVFYAASGVGWTPVQVGLITTVNFCVAAILSPIIGRYLDKYKPIYLIFVAVVSSSIGVFLFSTVTTESSIFRVLIVMVFIGTCSGCLNAALMKIVITEAPEGKKGVGTGTFALFKDLGLPLGATFGTTLYGVAQTSGFNKNLDSTLAQYNIDVAVKDDLLAVRAGEEVSPFLESAFQNVTITVEELLKQTNALSLDSAIQTVGMVNLGLCCVLFLLTFLLIKHKRVVEENLDLNRALNES